MNLPGLTLLADDLTGASEVAAGASNTWDARLIDWRHATHRLPPSPGEALSVNTGSRHLPTDQAAHRLADLLDRLDDNALLYKKCDSTLRGPIGAELAALRRRFPDRGLCYLGAIPSAGRTVRDGVLLVHGVPVAETDFARDPLYPVTTSSIPALLEEAGLSASGWRPGDPMPEGNAIMVADGETTSDLEALGELLASQPDPPLLAGARAFVPLIPLLYGEKGGGPTAQCRIQPPCLIVNGSLHPAGLAQIREAEASGVASVLLGPDAFFGPHSADILARHIAQARQIIESGGHVILRTVLEREETDRYRDAAEKQGIGGATMHDRLTTTLAEAAAGIMQERGSHSLISFGGELGEQLWRRLRVAEARMIGFAHEFLAVKEVIRDDGHPFVWASKPGGFGDADLLTGLLKEGADRDS